MILTFSLVDGEVLEFSVEKTSILIGRSNQCDVVIPFEGISRRHLQLDINGEEVMVTDLKSVNGVLIEGKKIEPEVPVNYPTYLGLAFGPVVSMQISFDKADPSRPLASSLGSTQRVVSDSTATRVHKKPAAGERIRPQREKPASSSSSSMESKLVNILIGLLIILAIAYFVTAKKPQEDVPVTNGPDLKAEKI